MRDPNFEAWNNSLTNGLDDGKVNYGARLYVAILGDGEDRARVSLGLVERVMDQVRRRVSEEEKKNGGGSEK